MAKIDDIKSQQPDSRLTSLGTVFRPGQKRIALPTSKQYLIPDSEKQEPYFNALNASVVTFEVTPGVGTSFSEIEKINVDNSQLGTTRHINSAQPDTSTRHNSAQEIETTDILIQGENLLRSQQKNINSAQPDTSINTNKSLNISELQLEEITDKQRVSLNIKKSMDLNFYSALDNIDSKVNNSTQQLDTTTRHNQAQQLGTTQHNPTQKHKNNASVPGTTRHNPTPGPAQLGTTTRHKKEVDPDFNEYQKKLNNLSGTAAQILSFLSKKCLDTGSNRVTVSYRILSELTNINFKSIPTTCKRLRNAGFFDLSGPKGGAQAVRHFDMSEFTIRAFANELLNPKTSALYGHQLGTTRHINSAQPDTWAGTNPSSMYVCNNKNTIHTYKDQSGPNPTPEPDPWLELRDVDFSSTDQFGIRSNVIETFKKNNWVITCEQLEEHLERFVRYFTEKEFEKRREPIKNPYSFFLSSIKAISKGEPDPICDVKTQFEIAQQMAMQNKLKEMEQRRREVESMEKQLDEYRDSEFEHWARGLGDNEKVQFVPPNRMAELGSGRYQLLLKDYFSQNIWPEVKQTVLMMPKS